MKLRSAQIRTSSTWQSQGRAFFNEHILYGVLRRKLCMRINPLKCEAFYGDIGVPNVSCLGLIPTNHLPSSSPASDVVIEINPRYAGVFL